MSTGRIPPRAYSDLFSFPLRTLVLKDASLQYTLPCDCGNLLICSIFTLGAKATGLMTPPKRLAFRGTPVSDVYFTISSTKTRRADIKEENERDTKESSCTWIKKKHWKCFRNPKLTRGEVGEKFLHFWAASSLSGLCPLEQSTCGESLCGAPTSGQSGSWLRGPALLPACKAFGPGDCIQP